MKHVVYDFDVIGMKKKDDYIFQIINDSSQTGVYHSHNFYEIVQFMRGSGNHVINEKMYKFSENCAVILRPGDRHHSTEQSKDSIRLSLSIRKEEFERFAEMYQEGLVKKINESEMPPYIVVEKNLPHICATLDEIGIPDDEYNCKFLLCCFLKTYLDGQQGTKDTLGVLTYALTKMQDPANLREGIAALTKLSGYSQSHLSRLTRKHFDMSLKQYINELRLQTAYKYIMFTDKKIEDIAVDVGFASVSHFNKLVKERFGTTPAALRKKGGMI